MTDPTGQNLINSPRIVGGYTFMYKPGSPLPTKIVNPWGSQDGVPHSACILNCWDSDLENCQGVVMFFLSNDVSLPYVVAGTVYASDMNSSKPLVSCYSWGNTAIQGQIIKSALQCFGWSPWYQEGYLTCDIILSSDLVNPPVIGGLCYATDSHSVQRGLTNSFWGISGRSSTRMFGGYGTTNEFGPSYLYLTAVFPENRPWH